jgi:hypothetical protein
MKKSVVLLIIVFIFTVLGAAVSAGQPIIFNDVKGTDWFKPYVDVMSEKGICVGYGNGKYGPKDNLQVDQLIKFVVIALGNNPQQGTGKSWADPYISKAKELGLIKDGEFNDYSKKITRGEIARIIARGMKETFPENLDAYMSLIKDYYKFSASKDREYILKVYSKGIVNGYLNGDFGSDDKATRAEASKMIICLIDPTKRTVIDTNKSNVVNGFTIPEVHTISAVMNENAVLYMMVHFRYSIDDQLSEAEKILKSKFSSDFVNQIMDYARLKEDIDYELIEKYFYTSGYKVYVQGAGWSTCVVVYKK